jgi:hypothetical protein
MLSYPRGGHIDTGVQFDHPALVGRYRGNNGNGHGTHTMGTGRRRRGRQPDRRGTPGPFGRDERAATWAKIAPTSPRASSGHWMLPPTDASGANPDVTKAAAPSSTNSWGNSPRSNNPYMEDVLQLSYTRTSRSAGRTKDRGWRRGCLNRVLLKLIGSPLFPFADCIPYCDSGEYGGCCAGGPFGGQEASERSEADREVEVLGAR